MNRNLLTFALISASTLTLTGCFGEGDQKYFLSVMNGSDAPARLTISHTTQTWTFAAGEARTIVVDKQNSSEIKAVRTFTIESNGKTTVAEGKVGYSGHQILDMTGTSCMVAADYGRQYGKYEIPKGETDIVLKKIYSPARYYQATQWDAEKAMSDFHVTLGLGQPLPKTIQRGKTANGPAQLVKIVNVPCEVIRDPRALYRALVQQPQASS